MSSYGFELENEFNTIYQFIKEKYDVNIKGKEQLAGFVKTSLFFLMSIKAWQKNLDIHFQKVKGIETYFQEIISNIIHIMILGTTDLMIPALIMLRRTQELILIYIYYSEHPIEFYKKESDDNVRFISGFNELKDYIKKYPYSMKYTLVDDRLADFVAKIVDDWTIQYKELSNYVHGSNSTYFKSAEYLDDFKFVKKDLNFISAQVEKTSSIVNSLLLVFYFNEYIKFDEYSEKSIIRNSISNKYDYKKNIVEILKEI